jgi:hypothetical protein
MKVNPGTAAATPLSSSALSDEILGIEVEDRASLTRQKGVGGGGNRDRIWRSVASPPTAATDFNTQRICEYRLVLCFDLLPISE